MAKIIKVGSQNPTFTSQNTKKTSPMHTRRNSNEATNPFKFTNFEGNTLQFADVFEGFQPTFKNNKLKMIASSVAGTMNKVKSGFEPIINFVNRVRGGFNSAIEYAKNSWEYAKNTNIEDVPVIKAMTPQIQFKANMPSFKGISDSMTNIGKGITSKLDYLNTDVTDVAKDLSAKWTTLISKIHTRRINADMPVAELEQLWKNEIELEGVTA